MDNDISRSGSVAGRRLMLAAFAGASLGMTRAGLSAAPAGAKVPDGAGHPEWCVIEFFDRLDALNFHNARAHPLKEGYAPNETPDPWELVTADGSWRRDQSRYSNRAEFMRLVDKLPAGLVTAHLVCNLRLIDAVADTAHACFRLLIYSNVNNIGSIPAKLEGAGAILSARAELNVQNAAWRIREIGTDTIFHF